MHVPIVGPAKRDRVGHLVRLPNLSARCLRADRIGRVHRVRWKPVAKDLVHAVPGGPQRPLRCRIDFAMLPQIKYGALDRSRSLRQDRLVELWLQARAVSQHELRLRPPVNDRLAPAAPGTSSRRELQFEQMPDNLVNLAVQLTAIRSAQALDLLG